MASKPYDKETENYYRLCCLLFEAGTEAMRQFFLTHVSDDGQPLPPNQFHVFIKQKKNEFIRTLKKDKRQKNLYKSQSELLFPPEEGEANINELDMTLLNILISNLCVCDKDELKKVTDLKNIRNDQAHNNGYRINLAEFVREWSRLSVILEALGVNRVVIDDYANKNINENDREMIITKIQQVLEDLEERVGDVEEMVDGMDERLEIVEQNQHDLSNTLMRLEDTEENKFLSGSREADENDGTPFNEQSLPSENLSMDDFRQLIKDFAQWFDRRKLLNRLQVLLLQYFPNNEALKRVTTTTKLLALLVERELLSQTNLSLLYDTIKLTEQFGFISTTKIKLRAFDNIREREVVSLSAHTKEIFNLGKKLSDSEIKTLDGRYNFPDLEDYTDSWSLILDFEPRGLLSENKMEEIKEVLKR